MRPTQPTRMSIEKQRTAPVSEDAEGAGTTVTQRSCKCEGGAAAAEKSRYYHVNSGSPLSGM